MSAKNYKRIRLVALATADATGAATRVHYLALSLTILFVMVSVDLLVDVSLI